jgi:23S rRNA pseudouridine1911/1915/1917 synthase
VKEKTMTYSISSEDEGLTIKSFLRGKKGFSRTLLVKLKQQKSVYLNGKFTYLDHPLKQGDVIHMVFLPEESEHIVPEEMELDIVFEDDDIMVMNKPSGLCVHPTLLHPQGTLANGVVHYWLKQGYRRKFRPVNRLDKDTTGLLIVAKSQWSHQQLALVQRKHEIKRTYEAIVHGRVEKDAGTIDAPIARNNVSLMEREVRADGQRAVTHYRVLQRGENATYVQLVLETGRTHQIRVHMGFLGHPLLGDDLYGGSRQWITRQALHARFLCFPHPASNEMMNFQADLPADFQSVLEHLFHFPK